MNDAEFTLVKQRVRVLTGIDLECYKDIQVRRRLDSYLSRTRTASWPEFLRKLSEDPQAVRQLRDFLTINVSSFFRDSHKWEDLRRAYLPTLLQPGHGVRAWSAGCSRGEEAYSLAILLQEQVSGLRHRVLGTDIDRGVLHIARAGGPYAADAVKDLAPALLRRYFRPEAGGYWVEPALQKRVEFGELDLLKSTACAEFDLVLCRNVLIYFTEEAKVRVLGGLIRALRPGGILFIGSTESIPPQGCAGLERVGLSFYRRVS